MERARPLTTPRKRPAGTMVDLRRIYNAWTGRTRRRGEDGEGEAEEARGK
jgi:hypothetical protein